MMKQWQNMLNQHELAMKQFVSLSWNTVKLVETVFHGHETTWIRMNHNETVFHGHETPWIRMKQCISWSWNTLFRGNDTPWICFMLFRGVSLLCLMLFQGVSLLCFMLFRGVSLLCFMLFEGVSLLCFMLFQGVSQLCFILSHGVSLLGFIVFQGVSLPCFILFHDHETGAVGTSKISFSGDAFSSKWKLTNVIVFYDHKWQMVSVGTAEIGIHPNWSKMDKRKHLLSAINYFTTAALWRSQETKVKCRSSVSNILLVTDPVAIDEEAGRHSDCLHWQIWYGKDSGSK